MNGALGLDSRIVSRPGHQSQWITSPMISSFSSLSLNDNAERNDTKET